MGVILTIMAGLRPKGVDPDYDNYVNAYVYGSERVEPAFIFISNFVKIVFDNIIGLFLVFAILGVTLKFIAIRQLSPFYLLSVLIYFSNFFFLHEMIQMRAGVASAILLLCIKPLCERNFKQFAILLILAVCFHYTALVFVFFIFIDPQKINRLLYTILIPIAYLVVLSGYTASYIIKYIPVDSVQVLFDMYSNDINGGIGNQLNIFNFIQLFKCSIYFFLLYNIHKILIFNMYAVLLIKIYAFSLIAFALFSDIPAISFRISELLSIVEIVIIPMILYIFHNKKVALFIPISISLIFLLINIFYNEIIF